MREIKFRAWWKHPEYNPKGEMYFVGGLMFATKQEGEPEYDDCNTPKEVGLMKRVNDYKIGWNDAKECVLMQYTGLKDKNGKEIYEGDIIRVGNGQLIEEIKWIQEKQWMTGECPFSGFVNHDAIYKKGVEIIGNIYENPTLLTLTKDI